jgi:hypothetical protein
MVEKKNSERRVVQGKFVDDNNQMKQSVAEKLTIFDSSRQ